MNSAANTLTESDALRHPERSYAWSAEPLLRETDTLLASSLDGQEILRRVTAFFVPRLADHCVLHVGNGDAGYHPVAASHPGGAQGSLLEEPRQAWSPDSTDSDGIVPQVIETGQAVLALEASYMAVPLLARGQTLGALTLAMANSGRRYMTQHLAVAEQLAGRAALALDNARLYAAEQTARRRAERLQAVTAALSKAVTQREVGDAVMQHGVVAMGAYAGVVALAAEDGAELELLSSVGYPEGTCMTVGRRWPMGANIPIAEATRTGDPVFVPSPEAWGLRYANGCTPKASASAAWAALPLTIDGTTIGAVLATFDQPRSFSRDDREFFLALARQCVQALERARLQEAEHHAREAAERVADLSRRLLTVTTALGEAASADRVARVIVEHGIEAVGADAGSLALVSPDGTQWEVVRSVGYPEPVREQWRRFPMVPGRPLSDSALARAPVLIRSGTEWAERYPTMVPTAKATECEAYAAVPIIAGGQAIAGLSFSFRSAQSFTDEVRTFLSTLGEQCALALERARLYEAERAARAEAEAANRAKSQFLAVMSHELRTPLNAIGGYTELLEMGIRGPVTDLQREDLQRIQRSQRHLLGLINDVLNFAKLEAGHVQFHRQDIPLHEVLAGIDALVEPQLRAKELRYECDASDSSLRIYADPEKVKQILLNLLSNAIKFTDVNGEIRVRCGATEDAVLIQVQDTGSGIPPDKLESVFEPFVQVDRNLASNHEGTGLGLAISRDLARAMGGDLVAETTLGGGSTFTLTLPRSPSG